MIDLSKVRYHTSYRLRKLFRTGQNLFNFYKFSRKTDPALFKHVIARMESPIFRSYSSVPKILFENKRINLEKALLTLNNVVILPNKYFSFWNVVGAPIASRGFVEGLGISRGKVTKSIGGGLCQLANAIHWLALHSDLRVTERHRHSLDIFPDDDRKVPFGTGATVFFNYKDLRLHNPTQRAYQFHFKLTDDKLYAELLASEATPYSYLVTEKSSFFENRNGVFFRNNVIVRSRYDMNSESNDEETLFSNCCECLYQPEGIL